MMEKRYLKGQEGSVLIVALLILVLLTLIGISVTTTTEVEINIAGNERLYKENLYLAESGAMECAQKMQEATELSPAVQSWLKGLGTVTNDDILNDAYWTANGQVSAVDSNTRYLAVEEGVSSDSSLDMTKTRLHSYAIYGRKFNTSRPDQGQSIVKIGFKKAF
ncbi:MAG: hypothetical protein JRJ31_19645 [Deltaproteobacteria bacterium]|nr:hypothetical protein [Deltaproteobacteria bacterium]